MMLPKLYLSKITRLINQKKKGKGFPNVSLKQLYLIQKLTVQNGF